MPLSYRLRYNIRKSSLYHIETFREQCIHLYFIIFNKREDVLIELLILLHPKLKKAKKTMGSEKNACQWAEWGRKVIFMVSKTIFKPLAWSAQSHEISRIYSIKSSWDMLKEFDLMGSYNKLPSTKNRNSEKENVSKSLFIVQTVHFYNDLA